MKDDGVNGKEISKNSKLYPLFDIVLDNDLSLTLF